jgi:molybdopterin synthase sulfur carrier subunit
MAMADSDLLHERAKVPAQVDTVTILYFAQLKEAFERASECFALPQSVETVGGLREYLRTRGGSWETELAPTKPVRVALNQEMAAPTARVSPGDEVAFFPPVTGG